MAFSFGTPFSSAQSTGFQFGASTSSAPSFGFGGSASSAAAPAFGASPGGFGASSSPGFFGASSGSSLFGSNSSGGSLFGAASTPAFGSSVPAFGSSNTSFGGFGQQQSQPGLFGASQQPQQQNQQQLSAFGASQPPQQFHAGSFGTVLGQQQQQAFNTTQLAAGVAPASQEIVAISRAFDKSSNDYRFRHLFLNVVDNPGSYGCPAGVGDLDWREATARAGGPNNPNRLWPVAVSGFDELLKRKNAQDTALQQHTERLQGAVDMARKLQRNEETTLKDRMEMVQRNHAGLSDQLLRTVRALDALEGRFAEQSHHHNSKTHQIHEGLARDLAQLEAVMAPNSAVGLLSRAEALTAASSVHEQHTAQNKSQGLSERDVDDVQQLLIQNTKVLTKLQEVLRKDNRDIAIMSDVQHDNGLALMTA
ncbi:hypothetical protein ABBQ32_013411 [Trebouxia sp. C0010 RCD-2024]